MSATDPSQSPAESQSSSGAPGKLGIKRVLIPTDFSAPSERAFIYAERFAEQFNAELIVVNVSEAVPPAPRYVPTADVLEHQEALHQATRKRMEQMHSRLSQTTTGSSQPPPRFLAVDGDAVDEILRISKEHDVDMIVIATHGHKGVKRLMLGSTTEKVVRNATCPVLVVRENEHEFVEVPETVQNG